LTAPSAAKRACKEGHPALSHWTTGERLAQRSRDFSFAMAKRACHALEHGRVLVQSDSVAPALGDSRNARRAPSEAMN
jgi:hypothetical protein